VTDIAFDADGKRMIPPMKASLVGTPPTQAEPVILQGAVLPKRLPGRTRLSAARN
jgi:hypothetical protein